MRRAIVVDTGRPLAGALGRPDRSTLVALVLAAIILAAIAI